MKKTDKSITQYYKELRIWQRRLESKIKSVAQIAESNWQNKPQADDFEEQY